MTKRLPGLDFLRATLMLLGILLHVISFAKPQQPQWWSNALFTGIYESIHNFRMPFFYLLSGYITSLLFRKLTLRDFLRNRLQRIGLVFLLGYLLVSLPTQYFRFLGHNLLQSGDLASTARNYTIGFFANLQLGNWEMGHLWFLFYLCLFTPTLLAIRWSLLAVSLRLSFLQHRFKNGKRIAFFVTASALVVLPAALLVNTGYADCPTPYSWVIDWSAFLFYFLFFAAGWAFHQIFTQTRRFQKFGLLLLGVAVMATFGKLLLHYKFKQVDLFYAALLYTSAIWLYIAGFVGLIARAKFVEARSIRYIAESCYWIYLVHLPLVFLLKALLLGLDDWQRFMLVLFLTPLLCFGSYQRFVRSTWVGVLLNGRKQPVVSASTVFRRYIGKPAKYTLNWRSGIEAIMVFVRKETMESGSKQPYI